ncbi:MAG: hypothetical protein O3C49_08490 [Proteobacteria bacterium]|nr:hypothetical protein [Pseudomonadota bacterium]
MRLEDAGWTVRVEIGLPHILNKKFADDPGDVDVLAWKKDRNEILVIECKDLSFARNYSEVAHMLSEFQGAEIKGKPDKLKRHLQRVEMLLNNRAGLETFCRIDDAMVKSALVCSGTVPMQFAKVKALKETYVGGAEGLIAMYS